MRPARLAAAALLAALVACTPSPPTPGKPVAIGEVCDQPDGSRVRLTGYLRYRRGLMSFCSTFSGRETCDLALYEDATTPPDFDILHPATGPEPVQAKLDVAVGGGPGRIDAIPREFKPSDIQLHLADGAKVSDGAHVTVDGELSVIPPSPGAAPAAKSCYLKVDWATAAR
jgi:hypothetical protein